MTKKIILFKVFIILLLSFGARAEQPFKCTSQYKTYVQGDTESVGFEGRITLFLKSDTEGFFSLSGHVKTSENTYLLSRHSYFTLAPQEINQVKQASITKVVKHPSDTTPDIVWLDYILPELPGIDFHIEIWPLKDNLVLIKSINTGYLVCAKI